MLARILKGAGKIRFCDLTFPLQFLYRLFDRDFWQSDRVSNTERRRLRFSKNN